MRTEKERDRGVRGTRTPSSLEGYGIQQVTQRRNFETLNPISLVGKKVPPILDNCRYKEVRPLSLGVSFSRFLFRTSLPAFFPVSHWE